MDANVYTRRLSGSSLGRLLAVLRPQLPFAMLEKVDDVDFPGSDEPLSPVEWPQGRAFGPDVEIRWEERGAGFDAWLVCDTPPSSRWTERLDLTPYEQESRAYYLWGPQDVALGRVLDYGAIPGKGRPQLKVAEYSHPENGRLVFVRYVSMKREGQA